MERILPRQRSLSPYPSWYNLPMDLHAPFHQQIQADADPRLTQGIYADWLEEQGDPRAELLRLGIEIRSLPRWPDCHQDFTLVERYHECDRALPDYLSETRFAWNVAARMPNVRPFGRELWFWWESVERGTGWAWVQVAWSRHYIHLRHVAYVNLKALRRQANRQLSEFTEVSRSGYPAAVHRIEADALFALAAQYPFCFDPILPPG